MCGGGRARESNMSRSLAVLMTAYNAEKSIGKAVESLKRDTEPFDLVIVDDCSATPVAALIDATAPDIEIIRPEKNLGVAGAKNFGLRHLLAKPYEFVAMMDADDICVASRLAKQVAFLKQHPDVALVGSWARYIDEDTREVVAHFRPPCKANDIYDALFLNNCIVHPTWMVRTEALRTSGLYSSEFPAAEDYELLRRMVGRFKIENLPEFLLDYTISMSGVSVSRRRRQLFDRLRIQAKYFEPGRRSAWIGVFRTLVLFVLPRKFVAAYRGEFNWRFQHP
jgi:glycosyltransferase involved in cell wall biosynthesis